ELAGEGEAGVGPLALVAEVDVLEAIKELDDFFVGLFEALVVANDGGVLGHGDAKFAPELEGILCTGIVEELLVHLGLAREFGRGSGVAFSSGETLCVVEGDGAGGESAEDAADE